MIGSGCWTGPGWRERSGRLSPLKELLLDELTPGDHIQSDEELTGQIVDTAQSFQHATASVPMGPKNDARAVVDATGRVHGIKNLRVVDASIFPDAVSTATNLTVIMAAELIADQIKAGR